MPKITFHAVARNLGKFAHAAKKWPLTVPIIFANYVWIIGDEHSANFSGLRVIGKNG
jgi:hypothetical protein